MFVDRDVGECSNNGDLILYVEPTSTSGRSICSHLDDPRLRAIQRNQGDRRDSADVALLFRLVDAVALDFLADLDGHVRDLILRDPDAARTPATTAALAEGASASPPCRPAADRDRPTPARPLPDAGRDSRRHIVRRGGNTDVTRFPALLAVGLPPRATTHCGRNQATRCHAPDGNRATCRLLDGGACSLSGSPGVPCQPPSWALRGAQRPLLQPSTFWRPCLATFLAAGQLSPLAAGPELSPLLFRARLLCCEKPCRVAFLAGMAFCSPPFLAAGFITVTAFRLGRPPSLSLAAAFPDRLGLLHPDRRFLFHDVNGVAGSPPHAGHRRGFGFLGHRGAISCAVSLADPACCSVAFTYGLRHGPPAPRSGDSSVVTLPSAHRTDWRRCGFRRRIPIRKSLPFTSTTLPSSSSKR